MKRFLTGVLALVMILSLTACKEASAQKQVFAMDTVMTLSAYGKPCEDALKEAEMELYRLEALQKTGSLFRDVDTPEPEEAALCEHFGWEFVARYQQFYIYRSFRQDAREPNTDPQVQALALRKVRRRLSSVKGSTQKPYSHSSMRLILGLMTGVPGTSLR